MTTQTEAQRLADDYGRAYAAAHLEATYGTSKSYTKEKMREANEARELLHAELRRLEAANAELLESLVDLVCLYPLDSTDAIITSARAAIKKHGGAA